MEENTKMQFNMFVYTQNLLFLSDLLLSETHQFLSVNKGYYLDGNDAFYDRQPIFQ